MEEGRFISNNNKMHLDFVHQLSQSYFLCLGKDIYLESVYLANSAYFTMQHLNNARIYSFSNFVCLVILPEWIIVPEKLTPRSAWSSSLPF